MDSPLDTSTQWIVFEYLHANDVLLLIDAGLDVPMLHNPIFWNHVWAHHDTQQKRQQTPTTRARVLSKMLRNDSMTDSSTTAIRILCRTQLHLEDTACAHRARSRLLFVEADLLQAPYSQRFLVPNNDTHGNVRAKSLDSAKLVHGMVHLTIQAEAEVFDALFKIFLRNNYYFSLHDVEEIPHDSISPNIENPFAYYKALMIDVLDRPQDQNPKNFLVVFYAAVHRASMRELFVWHLQRRGLDELIPVIDRVDFATITCVGWYVQRWCKEDAVVIDFGLHLVDYLKLCAKQYVEGNMLFSNVFEYIQFYVRDTDIISAHVHSQVDPECVVYKGTQITLRTECEAVSKTFSLTTTGCKLTLQQLVFFVWELYCHTLSEAEYEAVLADRAMQSDRENNPQGQAAYHHFIWNHHHVNIVGSNHIFTCVARDED